LDIEVFQQARRFLSEDVCNSLICGRPSLSREVE
jgi:hypothetical protein